MNDNKVEITLLTSNKSGILSSIMVKGSKLGLMYRRNQSEKIDDDRSRMVIFFDGNLNCTKGEVIDAMESHPEIHSVESISLGDAATATQTSSNTAQSTAAAPAASSAPPVNTALASLRAHDIITPESLQIAEEKLVNVLGPVAPMLIKSAASKTKHIGDLYLLLSDELEGEERKNFLALVSDLNLDQLR